MCGITGFFDPSSIIAAKEYPCIITGMMDTIIHRGPDDSGFWKDDTKGIVLGFRRLAIVDLTPTGHQPMISADGRFVMIFNGEVYNFEEIRQELLQLGHSFRGTSDTEVMLEAISQWGVKSSLSRFNGMFAFALWDRQECALVLARDRMGIKPLYYGWVNHVFIFGSELKAIKANPLFHESINRDALCLFLRHNYIPAPFSIYERINKLHPGTFISIQLDANNQLSQPQPYWSVYNAVEEGVNHPFEGSDQEAIEELETLLQRSIRQRMISDVPLGAFLSGGLDSSTIVALMQTQSSIPVKTFTIGFNEQGYDEAKFARKVADYLKTDHTELYVSPEETRSVIPLLPQLYDEPFSDTSQIPTFLVARLARQKVTVSLSGDGGDELFAGYHHYSRIYQYSKMNSFMNGSFSKSANLILQAGTSSRTNWFWGNLSQTLPNGHIERIRSRMIRLAEILSQPSPEKTYRYLTSHWKVPDQVVINGQEPLTVLMDRKNWPSFNNIFDMMMYLDIMTYLTDGILVKVDRASMGVSLESRAPLLDDHRVIEFAWRLPKSMKIRHGKSKWILRNVLYRHVPPSLVERPKMGFGVPIDTWLRGPLKDWAETLLNKSLMKQQGVFNPEPIHQKWSDHIKGINNWGDYLWDILMFQSWLDFNKAA